MSKLVVLATLFSYKDRAADGSLIPRSSVEAYINSQDWKNQTTSRLALGGITHLNRTASTETSDKIGPDDDMLLNRNSTHLITKIFIKDDGYVWAEIEIFDPEGFDTETSEKIKQVRALIERGIQLPISVVIKAYWDTTETAIEIYTIKGCDITLNPSFAGSQIKEIITK